MRLDVQDQIQVACRSAIGSGFSLTANGNHRIRVHTSGNIHSDGDGLSHLTGTAALRTGCFNDLTGTELDDVFSAGNYSLFSVDSIDGAGSVKGDKLTIGQGVTAIFRGTISDIDIITIGNNTEIYASTEATNILKNTAPENDTVTWYNIGSADVAKGFTDAKSENADDEGIDTREGAVFQNGTNGWLSNGDIQDFVDYIQLSDDGTWEITDAGGNLNVTLHEITASGLTEITTAANVSYEDGTWTISDYDAETMVVCVEIAKVDEVTKRGTFGYTTTLA